ncbi:MAG TPA: hypothetical protein VJ771_07535, partial [Candidatus Nitrosotalea sp.]|nr:hypothetical protein [Candidatus Nitrosotalea sp.]
YMIIYALKKVYTLLAAYSLAFTVLLSVYYFGQNFIQSGITRYFAGLVLAFVILSVFSIYQHYKMLRHSKTILSDVPHFYKPAAVTKKTLSSRFSIQLWESIPGSVYGVVYFVMMFSDRLLSWMYNPVHLKENFGLPMAFNATYHIGADTALMVLMPATVIQYVIMMPMHIQINNICVKTTISQQDVVNSFIRGIYRKVIIVSLVTSLVIAGILNFFVPDMMMHSGVGQTSIQILRIASVANILMCIFTANSIFLAWLNKTKFLLGITILSSVIVLANGILSDHAQLQNLTLGYLAACAFAAVVSTIYTRKILNRASNIFFARSF